MAQRFQSIAVVGATGNLGVVLVEALQEAQPPFASISVLTRSAMSGTKKYPANVHVKTVDYSSHDSLVSALSGADAVVSAVATQSIDGQKAIIDAAVAAGVKFFIPSEFGMASNQPALNRDFPIFADKVEIQKHLAALKSEGKIDYALIFTSLWLDWGLAGFVLDVPHRRVQLWDGGERPTSLTSLRSITKAIIGVLEGRTAGKTEVRVKDVNISQRRLYELAVVALGEDGWDVTTLDTAKAAAEAKPKLEDGTASLDDIYTFVKRAAVGEEYGMPWAPEEDDSATLGIEPWTDSDVLGLVRRIAASKD